VQSHLEEFLKSTGSWEEGWRVHEYGDMFICPCGYNIEMDGECPIGHKSPLLTNGLI